MPYYINAPTLSSATAVYDDPQMTICSANGYYADGPIVRQQIDCVLLPAQDCPFCGAECGCSFSGPVNKGVYYFSVQLGSGTGPVAIRFGALQSPNGIEVIYDSTVYNQVVSSSFGSLSAPSGLPVFIGSDLEDCGIVGSHVLEEFEFTSSDNSFHRLGTTDTVNVVASQSQLTFSDPGLCTMIIPKPNPNPDSLLIKVISPCDLDSFDITTYCPGAYTVYELGGGEGGPLDLICGYTNYGFTYYVIPINGDGTTLGYYDLLYYDSSCSLPVADNYYLSPNCPTPYQWFRTEKGIIVEFGECGDAFSYIVAQCGNPDATNIFVLSPFTLSEGDVVSLSDPIYEGCRFQVKEPSSEIPTALVVTKYEYKCDSVCVYYKVYNRDIKPSLIDYKDCAGVAQVTTVPLHSFIYLCAQSDSISSKELIDIAFESCQCPS